MKKAERSPSMQMHDSLIELGWERIPVTHERAYLRHGQAYVTWVKRGVTIASSWTSRSLNTERNIVEEFEGCGCAVTIELLRTDKDWRNRGRARSALREWLDVAKARNVEVYVEPVPLEIGVDRARLITFYRHAGFFSHDNTSRVMGSKRNFK